MFKKFPVLLTTLLVIALATAFAYADIDVDTGTFDIDFGPAIESTVNGSGDANINVVNGKVILNGRFGVLTVDDGEVYAMPGSSFDSCVLNGGSVHLNGASVLSESGSSLTVFGGHVVATNTDFSVKQYDALLGDYNCNDNPIVYVEVQSFATSTDVEFYGCRITGKPQSYVDPFYGDTMYSANPAMEIYNGNVLASDTDLKSFATEAVYMIQADSAFNCKFTLEGNSKINETDGASVGVLLSNGAELVMGGNAAIYGNGAAYLYGNAACGVNDEIYGVYVETADAKFEMKDNAKISLKANATLGGSASVLYGVYNKGTSIVASGSIDLTASRFIIANGLWNEKSMIVGTSSTGPVVNVNAMHGASLMSKENASLALNSGRFSGEMQVLDSLANMYSVSSNFGDFLAEGKALLDANTNEVLCTKGAVDAGASYGGYNRASGGMQTIIIGNWTAPVPSPDPTPDPTPTPSPTPGPTPGPAPSPTPTPSPSPSYDDYDDYEEPVKELEELNWTTRGEMVMALYEAEGKPQMGLFADLPFEDVPKDHECYEAVRWAYSIQLVQGTSPSTFEPDKSVCKEDAATFIWNYLGRPGRAEGGDKYFTNALKWLKIYPDAIKELKETKLKKCFDAAE